MNYSDFIKKAYPNDKVEFDQKLTIVSRFYRPLGLSIGYLCWKVGIKANIISVIRILIVLFGFFLLTLGGANFLIWRIIGFLLIWFSKILDYSDGVIARASESTSYLGKRLDELGDEPILNGMALSLVAFFTGHLFLIPFSIFLEFVIQQFGAPFKQKDCKKQKIIEEKKPKFIRNIITNHLLSRYDEEDKTDSAPFLMLNFISKVFKSHFMHTMVIPLFLALFNDPEAYIWFPKVCIVIIMLYTFVAIIRFVGGVRYLSDLLN